MKALHQGGASAIASFGLLRRNALRSGLVVTQVALAIVLLIAGSLLMHSFLKLVRVDPGFEPGSVLTFNLRMPPARSTPAEIARVAPDLVARLRSLPGVSGAGYTFALPTVSLGMGLVFRLSPDEPLPQLAPGAPSTGVNPGLLLVSEGYTRALGMRVRRGRDLDDYGRSGGRRGILINQSLARERFPNTDPVGRAVYLAGDRTPWEVAGVVDDVWTGLDRAPGPQVLREFPTAPASELQMLGTRYYYAVRTTRPAGAIVPAIRDIVRQIDDQAFLDNLVPLEELLADSIARPRLYAVLLGVFGATALVLAAIGIYGVMAYAVTQAVREIGLRIALGAEAGDVVTLVLGRAAILTAVGIALGVAGAAAASQYLRGMLFGLTPLDVRTYVAVVAGFSGVAMLAAYVPARRAASGDPLSALRAE
jgi:putative ABC transport system permease protein